MFKNIFHSLSIESLQLPFHFLILIGPNVGQPAYYIQLLAVFFFARITLNLLTLVIFF